jgi:hypothetical protein
LRWVESLVYTLGKEKADAVNASRQKHFTKSGQVHDIMVNVFEGLNIPREQASSDCHRGGSGIAS